jgi:hypothetical protein
VRAFLLFLLLFPCVRRIGGKETLGGLERWFSPRGQDLAFLLSRIGLVRPPIGYDLKQNKKLRTAPLPPFNFLSRVTQCPKAYGEGDVGQV